MDALSRFSLRNRALTALLTVFAIAAGFWSTVTLKQELFPSLQLPVIGVVTTVPGANAEVVEGRVTKPMEAAVLSLRGVDQVTARSQGSVSTVLVQLTYGEDLGRAQNEAQRAVMNVRNLPEGASTSVFAGSIDDFPIISMSVSGGADKYALLSKVQKIAVPKIADIEGVRDVQVSGVAAQKLTIDVDQAKLAQLGVKPEALANVLRDNGVEFPAGTIPGADGKELSVQAGSTLRSVEEVQRLPLAARTGSVKLSDVASVTLQEPPATSYTRTNGEPSLTVSIVKTPDGNTVAISRELNAMLADLEKDMGGDAKINVVFDNAPFIQESITDLGTEGALGLAFAVLVVFVFLLSVRLTLVTAVSIPLSLLIALLGLRIGGGTLNIITLAALTITVGRVVDDSIVVIENIQRHIHMGQDKRTAIPRAVKEVAGAVTSSTLTTVAVFLPLALVGDVTGELFRPFALTVTLAMLASLFVALTIVPVLGYWFLKSAPVDQVVEDDNAFHEPVTRVQRAYLPVLLWSLRHKVITSLLALALLAASLYGATHLKTDFIGSAGGNTLTISQQLPQGTSLADTDAKAREVERALADRDDVESYQVTVGAGELAVFTGGSASTATFNLTLKAGADATKTQRDLEAYADAHPALGALTVSSGQQGFGNQTEIVITAPDDAALRTAVDTVSERMKSLSSVRDVTSDLTALVPSVVITADRTKAAEAGLSEAAVSGLVSVALRGQNLGQVTFDGLTHDVLLRMSAAPATLDGLKKVVVGVGPRGPLTLADVATVKEEMKPATLTRIDGQRSASVSGTPTTDNLSEVTTQLQEIVDSVELPAGVKASVGGVSADQAEAFQQLGLAIVIAIAITYAILVATFKSLLQPLILLVSIPFAATGAIALLLATGTPLGLPAIIGVLMLVGIVVTNAIVLIDLVNQYRERGATLRVAVIEGARHRLRPIIMTALATILALTPMALSLTGGGAFISQPLAIVTIGGLFSSTLLTLILVPVLYVWVERARGRRSRRRELAAAEATARPAAVETRTPVPLTSAATERAGEPGRGASAGPTSGAAVDSPAPQRAAAEGADRERSAVSEPADRTGGDALASLSDETADAVTTHAVADESKVTRAADAEPVSAFPVVRSGEADPGADSAGAVPTHALVGGSDGGERAGAGPAPRHAVSEETVTTPVSGSAPVEAEDSVAPASAPRDVDEPSVRGLTDAAADGASGERDPGREQAGALPEPETPPTQSSPARALPEEGAGPTARSTPARAMPVSWPSATPVWGDDPGSLDDDARPARARED